MSVSTHHSAVHLVIIIISSYRASCSGNYRQLQLLRGVRGVEETEEERAARPMTRGEAVNWYRSGGQHLVEQEAEVASLSGNWKQFHLMTRGRQEPRDEDQVPSVRISTPIT